jgi:uncharacterized membrane protein YfcA
MASLTDILAVFSGVLVGFVLSLIGGGGSILAVPLLLYVVGVKDTHLAVGTSAVAVAANALIGLVGHARAHTVNWPCAATFAAAGVIGAWFGSTLGKLTDGEILLALFALAMIAVGVSMLRKRRTDGDPLISLTPKIAVRLAALGLIVGFAAGFFGIGGGFLIVPGIMVGSGMPMLNAVGSSLLSVAALGAATATNYAASSLVDWRIAILFIVGGFVGSIGGLAASKHLAARKGALNTTFGWVVILTGVYILVRFAVG